MLRELVTHGTPQEIEMALGSQRLFEADELFAALLSAIQKGDPGLVKMLLDRGANPNRVVHGEWCALHVAVEHQQREIIRMLVDAGANINQRDQTGSIPLHVAVDLEGDSAWQSVARPTAALTRLLLELGADPSLKNGAGKTPVEVAEDYGHEEAMALLREKVSQ